MNRRMRLGCSLLLTIVILFTAAPRSIAEQLTVASPDGTLEVEFALQDGSPVYSLRRFGAELIRPSRLGFLLSDAPPLDGGFDVAAVDRSSMCDTWTQPWGEKKSILNACNELRVLLRQKDSLARELVIVFRVFDDGVGFRYEWPKQPHLTDLIISDELTEFALAEDSVAWWIPAYEENRYEYLYRRTPVSQLTKAHTPATFETPDGICYSIHEAALTDFASMTLAGVGDLKLKADLVPWSDGTKVKARLPHRSPWRTIQVGDNPGELITSHLILNLNEPCQIDDVSWIQPGKYTGVWWEMHLGRSTWGPGDRHGANTANVKRLIDFAAANRLDGVLVEGWNEGWDGDWPAHGDRFSFTRAYPDFNITEVTRYAKEKGVYLIGHHETAGAVMNYERQLDDAFSMYEALGVRAVKTGYVNWGRGIKRLDEQGRERHEWHHGQHMVRHYRRVVEEAAKHKIMLDVHEPIKPTGIRRTYPNMMTCEGARGQEYNAWSEDGGNPPDHTTILPFTRLLAGPMDFTPGIFDLLFQQDRPHNRVNTTLAKQLALYVVIYSPLQMVPDLPENYARHPDALQFIRDVPTNWEDTRVLDARIGDYVTIVRKQRDGDDWYLGSITDEVGRTLSVPLAFLDGDRAYVAETYRDADDADWQTKPLAYTIERREVDVHTTLPLRLAPGGGQAIRFRPIDR